MTGHSKPRSRRMLSPRCWLPLILLAAPGLVSAQVTPPMIASGGVVNVASFVPVGLPNSAIAQGSMLTIFGQDLGPDELQVADSFPLPTELGGTSVQVSVAGVTLDCIMIFASATQVAVIMPSATPLGDGEVRVSFDGVASDPEPIKIAESSFGTFTLNQTGGGAAVVQNFISQAEQPLNGFTQAANPGQVVTIWGTGLGPVGGDEAAGPLPGNLDIQAELFVGGAQARVIYGGRSGCCAGVDQIVAEIPESVRGCSVPVVISANGVASNYTSISIAEEGTVCSDVHGFSAEEVQNLFSGRPLRVGSVALRVHVNEMSFEDSFEDAQGAFVEYAPEDIFTAFPPPASILHFESPSLDSCVVSVARLQGAAGDPPPQPAPLDAGPNLSLTGPNGEEQLPNDAPGSYFAVLTRQPPGMRDPFFDPGTYTVMGAGGQDIGPFSVELHLPQFLTWTNKDQIENIPRDQPLTIAWDTDRPTSELVKITGSSGSPTLGVRANFSCLVRAGNGSFEIPLKVLSSLPPSELREGFSTGFLEVQSLSVPASFSAPNLDLGSFTYQGMIGGKSVTYE